MDCMRDVVYIVCKGDVMYEGGDVMCKEAACCAGGV